MAANTDGSLLSRQGYLPWGELRYTEGSLPGRYQFTGQASYEAEFGLYYYKARWYDPSLGRWASPGVLRGHERLSLTKAFSHATIHSVFKGI